MTFWTWSRTASSNATADSTVNFAEGQAPSSLNDSCRAAMAALAKRRDDTNGTITTSGTSTAYTVTSYQVFDTLAHMDGAVIAFVPHTTSGAAPTLNVDGLGAKKIRFQTGVDLVAGCLIAGTPYVVTYYNSATEFLIHNVAGNPYNVPLGAGMDYWGSTAPNSAFALPIGQAISRTTYATLFSLIGTTYGTGDGSTTFNLPNKTGRVSAMVESSPTRLTSTYFGGNSTVLGATGGSESHTLTTAELPTNIGTATTTVTMNDTGNTVIAGGGGSLGFSGGGTHTTTTLSATATTTLSGGSGNAHAIVPPTIICNYILRVL